MNIDVEPYLEVLFAKLKASARRFRTFDRKLVHWSDIPEANFPALFLTHPGDTDDADPETLLSITTVEFEIWIATAKGKAKDFPADVALSTLVTPVRAAFAPDAGPGDPRCTLGGKVYWARLEGRSTYFPGDQGPIGVAHIPGRMTLQPQ